MGGGDGDGEQENCYLYLLNQHWVKVLERKIAIKDMMFLKFVIDTKYVYTNRTVAHQNTLKKNHYT